MEKGLARFRVSLLCFCCGWFCCGCFVAAGLLCCLLQLLCCSCFVALFCCTEVADSSRRSFPLRGPLPFSGANAACNCLPPQRRRYSNRVLVQCPFRVANASCGCLPRQRCRYSNRVLVQCPVGLPMPPATVCHLSAAGTPTASWSSALLGLPMPPAAVCHLSAAGTPTASWHGDHAHKYSRGILAWRSITQPISDRSHPSVLPGLRHSDPTHKPSVQSPRVKPVIYRHFGTGTLPTGISEADCLGR